MRYGEWLARLAASVSVLLFLGAVAACGKTIGDTIDDSTITTRVKAALLNDPGVSALKIDVETVQGVVTLSGAVKSAQERDAAVRIAQRTRGVKDVRSTLQITPQS